MRLFWLGLAILVSGAAFGESVQVSAGYAPGAFSVSVFGDKTGVVFEALSYYQKAGSVATEIKGCPACPYTIHAIPAEKDHAIVESPLADGQWVPFLLWNFLIPVDALRELRGSGQGTYLGFGGPMADTMYRGMGGVLQPVGYTVHQDGTQIGPIYQGKALGCSKREAKQAGTVETLCYLMLR